MRDPRTTLSRPAPKVAAELLGWTLHSISPEGVVTVVLTEVEAYSGTADPASHAWRGRTPRNAVMFGPAGRLYVYVSYGMHHCANVVTGPDGEASAVLLRAGRVVEGAELARRRRGPDVADRSLARGPACLTQALGIGRDHYGLDLLEEGPIRLAPAEPSGPVASGLVASGPVTSGLVTSGPVASGPRVGVSRAAEVPWRFWLDGDPTVSAYKRGVRVRARG
ncbi:MAG: DNA-3-methyladenine glycosylase [Nocardioidaceae bacterium]